MNKSQKTDVVSFIKNEVLPANFILLFYYRGLSDKKLFDLRSNLKSKEAKLKIFKNTLFKVAVSGTQFEFLTPHLKGPIAVAYSSDPISVSKAVVDSSDTGFVQIQIASLDKKAMNVEEVKDLSKLGSVQDVRASFVALLNSAQSAFVRTLEAASSAQSEGSADQ